MLRHCTLQPLYHDPAIVYYCTVSNNVVPRVQQQSLSLRRRPSSYPHHLNHREQDIFLPRSAMRAPTGSELRSVRPDADVILSAADEKRKREDSGRSSVLRSLVNRLQFAPAFVDNIKRRHLIVDDSVARIPSPSDLSRPKYSRQLDESGFALHRPPSPPKYHCITIGPSPPHFCRVCRRCRVSRTNSGR